MNYKENWENPGKWRDYYKDLNCTFESSFETIRNNYHDLARQYNTRQATDPKAMEAFKIINEAYHILSKPEKRAKYDMVYKKRMKTPNSKKDILKKIFDQLAQVKMKKKKGFVDKQKQNTPSTALMAIQHEKIRAEAKEKAHTKKVKTPSRNYLKEAFDCLAKELQERKKKTVKTAAKKNMTTNEKTNDTAAKKVVTKSPITASELRRRIISNKNRMSIEIDIIGEEVKKLLEDLKAGKLNVVQFGAVKDRLVKKINEVMYILNNLLTNARKVNGHLDEEVIKEIKRLELLKQNIPRNYLAAIMKVKKDAKKKEISQLFKIITTNLSYLTDQMDRLLFKAYKVGLTPDEYEKSKNEILTNFQRYLLIAENNGSRAVSLGLESEYQELYNKIGLVSLQLEERNVSYFAAKSGIIIETKQLERARTLLNESENNIALHDAHKLKGLKVSQVDYFNYCENRTIQQKNIAELSNYIASMKTASSEEDQNVAYTIAAIEGIKAETESLRKEYHRWSNDNSLDARIYVQKCVAKNNIDRANFSKLKSQLNQNVATTDAKRSLIR